MNHSHLKIILLALSFVGFAASAGDISTNAWHPNTRLLDLAEQRHDSNTNDATNTLARDVKKFYELLRDKKWKETYKLRAKAFRKDFLEADYLVRGELTGNNWGLVNYEVLSVKFQNSYGSENFDQAMLIFKFTELPGKDSYSVVYWHHEDGVWRCLSAGPSRLDIFEGTRAPIIDWR
jgi:hypothetical protein